MSTRRLFLSMVSDEFRAYRELLCGDLERGGVDVATQEKWGTLGETTLEKLDTHLRQCDAVIHLVGDGLGHVPPPAAVEALLARHPGFLAKLAGHTGLTREMLGGCSYTQWEAYLALFHGVRLHIYRPVDHPRHDPAYRAPREPGFVAREGEKRLQADHFDRIRKLGRDRDVFLNQERLSSFVLADLNDILPPRETRVVVFLPRLPHAPRELIGRETWLAGLDAAWQDAHRHVVVVRAWGGAGKTALVTSWMAEMEYKDWREAQRVFYWSFYSQGTRRQGDAAASADTFIAKALTFFGDADPTLGSPRDRGERLARLVGKTKNLLVLDGVEPLQHPPGPQAGQLTDPALEALLGGLAAQNAGMCVVTTRESLTDLDGRKTAVTWALDRLTPEAGAALLHHHGVRRAGKGEIGPEDVELRTASTEVAGHALTLTLMGKYLSLACGGDIRQRDTLRFAEADPEWVTSDDPASPYGHAFKVIAAYERWFLDEKHRPNPRERVEGRRQLALLRLLGLFNRPASADCLNALLQPPVIAPLTEALAGISTREWTIAVQRLADAGLLTAVEGEATSGIVHHTLDAHPLIREYFAKQLREQHAEAFRAAHSRLFDHLCATTPPRPDTLAGLQPLYQAVTHGCLAGRQHDALYQVYIDRILRGTGSDGFYSSKKLGAIGADLGAVAAFFDEPWSRLSPNLSASDQAWVLAVAAFYLRAVGRLTEAVEPMRVSLQMAVEMEKWKEAAIRASNLSELEVTLGQLIDAVTDGHRGVELADRSADASWRMVTRTTTADALHQAGERAEAGAFFAEAEQMQAERQPELPLLYSLAGFRYADLLLAPAERAAWWATLDRADGSSKSITGVGCADHLVSGVDPFAACAEAERRVQETLQWAITYQGSLLSIALDHLTQVRAALYRAFLTPADSHQLSALKSQIPASLTKLRAANQVHHLPLALLTAALYHGTLGADPAAAAALLDEAQQIAERGPMPLYLADVHLHRARLAARLPEAARRKGFPGVDPKAELAKARALIEKHGYGRRREELADAEAAATGWS